MPPLDFDKELKVCEAATPGPWRPHDYRHDPSQEDWFGLVQGAIECFAGEVVQIARVKYSALPSGMNWANLQFCASARTNYPEALRRLVRLREIIGKAEVTDKVTIEFRDGEALNNILRLRCSDDQLSEIRELLNIKGE